MLNQQLSRLTFRQWRIIILDVLLFVGRRWYMVLLALIASVVIGYFCRPTKQTTYTATFTFVLSTETKSGGITGLASQLGLEVGAGGSENIFSGDNILELFKSRKMVTSAFKHPVDDSGTDMLAYLVKKLYPDQAKQVLPFPANETRFNPAQKNMFERMIELVTRSFSVGKKDKKLIFYYISSTTASPDISYLVAKNMLDQTSEFFIETKIRVATTSMQLLQKEADSLGRLLGYTYQSTASLADRTFNINPSILVQRSGAQLGQAKAAALSAAFAEVMRNLELSKINIQKETPLFQVIDEPVLPIAAQSNDVNVGLYYAGFLGLFLMIGLLCVERLLTWIKF